MAKALQRPKRKNPLARTPQPAGLPAARSRQAHLLTAAAAQGIFGMPACVECEAVHYPPRDICPRCLSAEIGMREASPLGTLISVTSVHASTEVYFRERSPWRAGLTVLDAGPSVMCHVHGDCSVGERVRLDWKLDKNGNAAAFAMPHKETPDMMDDAQLREMTCDPRFRRVLVTDARSALGQSVAKALADAGASVIFAGVADMWKPFPGRAALVKIPGIELTPLNLTDTKSVHDLAAAIGARVDILINTSEHIRPGGLMDRNGVALAREEFEAGYLGLLRLAQAFGPVMRFRGADGAAAFVNIISIYAQMSWPAYGAYSAAQAALLAASQSLRAELRPGGVRVINVFTGPIDNEWFQALPPPKVAPAQIGNAIVDALRRGIEDAYVGDVAEDFRARLQLNPKALERELGQ